MSSDAHGATVPAGHGLHHPYHLVNPSPWPIVGALGGLCTVLGIIFAAHFGSYVMLVIGAILVLGTMFFWWRDVVKESRTPGLHTPVVRLGLRYGMIFFITSEVMFFVGFFWAYFNFLIFPETQGNGMTVWPPSTIHSLRKMCASTVLIWQIPKKLSNPRTTNASGVHERPASRSR